MNRMLKIAITSLLLGSATLAVAQSPAQSFADRYREMQAIASPGPAYHDAPTFSSKPADPTPRLSFAQMQAMSSESPVFQPDHGKIEVSNGPTFAQTNPRGLPFEAYQAASSESMVFQLPLDSNTTAYATAPAGASQTN